MFPRYYIRSNVIFITHECNIKGRGKKKGEHFNIQQIRVKLLTYVSSVLNVSVMNLQRPFQINNTVLGPRFL